jgi:alpha-L-rhamnosidase
MGQNMVGFPKIFIKNGKPGQVITMRFAEVLYPDLAEYAGQKGMIMLENIRAALAQDSTFYKEATNTFNLASPSMVIATSKLRA